MKRKKGFTLIELIAVIVILAIIALIVSPIVNNMIDQSKIKSAQRSVDGYIHSLNTAISQYSLMNKGKYPTNISQVSEYIDYIGKEIQIKSSSISEGEIKKLVAIVNGYTCTFKINKEIKCVENDMEPTSLIMSPKNSELANTIGISTSCVLFHGLSSDECTDEEINKLSDYISNTYNISFTCFTDYKQCASGDNTMRNNAGEDFNEDMMNTMFSFYGLGIEKFISSIEFTKEQPLSAESKDISESQDGSVLLYSIPAEDDKIDVKIYSKNKIKLPKDSFFFFSGPMMTHIEFNNMVDTSDVENFFGMFMYCQNLISLDLSSFDTSNATNMSYMFYYCKNLANLNISSFDTGNVTNMCMMFGGIIVESLDVSHFDTSNVIDMTAVFAYCRNLKDLNLNGWNTSNVTNMNLMFAGIGLESLKLNFDTRKVTDMSDMFEYCENLQTLDLSKLNTSNVTNMNGMFAYCPKLANLDISNFDTSKVTNFNCLFIQCYGLTSLDLSHFNTSNVENMRGVFWDCTGLTSLNLSGWNTEKVTIFSDTFRGCTSLTSLDISGFDTRNNKDIDRMFYNDSNLEHIYVGSNWDISQVTTHKQTFYNCVKLPNFNSSKVDKTNANTSATGYLTLKTA